MNRTHKTNRTRRWTLPAILLCLVALAIGMSRIITLPEREPIAPDSIPVVMGHREGCVLCHADMTGFTPSHDPEILGCSGCHLGNPLTSDKTAAHEGMILITGNLETAMETCGQAGCHPSQVSKVLGSLMGSGKGMVSVNRYVFGESDTPDGPGHLSHLTDTAADTHLRQLCVTCHLNFPKNEARPIDEKSRGGGCLACHLTYSDSAKNQLVSYGKNGELPTVHPALDIKVQDDRCFGCHSRSARISLNYQGYMETMLKAENTEDSHPYRILQDQRVVEFKGADIHHQKGMDCIDCHTVREVMGDGLPYNHQGEQVEVSCEDCHTKEKPQTVSFEALDADSKKILRLRQKDQTETRYVLSKKTDRPLLNLTTRNGTRLLFQGKLDEVWRDMNPPAEVCEGIDGHDRLTCQSCHTSWTPVCINCHTQFEPKRTHKDHYTGEMVQGAWREYKGLLEALPPTLGVRVDKRTGDDVVDTFIPGMIMTIHGIKDNKPDTQALPGNPKDGFQIFRRLFSPTFSHTIQKESISCEGCHKNSWSLGYGLGTLERITPDASADLPLRFIPKMSKHPADGLPRDAWTGFLETRSDTVSTRIGSRPFNQNEQEAILTVGLCLDCHRPTENEIATIYTRFDWALENRIPVCYTSAPSK